MKKFIIQLALLFIVSTLSGQNNIVPAYKNPALPTEKRISDLIRRMTLDEKILQLNQYISGYNPNANNVGEIIKDIPAGIGSLLYFGNDPHVRNEFQRKAMQESRLGIPIIFGFDVIHGFRTIYPISLAQACSWNPKLVEEACAVAAQEAKLSGIDWTFSPMIDVSRDPRWGRVAECYGEDSYANSVFGVATVNGYQGKNLSDPYSIAACLKHYVGYGVSEGGRDYRYTDISKQALWETYIPPYEACVKAGAATVMSAFNDISGVPATANYYTLTEILKNRWQFDGFVVSDWNAVTQLVYQGLAAENKEAAYKAFLAGLEMDMKDNAYRENLAALVAEKKIPIKKIDEAVSRVLRIKFRLGLFENPYTTILDESNRYLQPEAKRIAEKLAAESMVLLKNSNNILPLKTEKKRIAIIGPLAKNNSEIMGAWSFNGKEEDTETFWDGCNKEFKNSQLFYAKGCDLDGNDYSGFDEAICTAKNADMVLLFLGEMKTWSGENASRSSIALPAIQEKLMTELSKTGKPIVLVLSNGRPLELVRLEPLASAILEAWQPGTFGGSALAGILSGRINPSGKLAMTFPLTTGQIPIYYNMRQSARPFDKMGDYQDISTEPLYWFGHGLSYTTFEYGNVKLSAQSIKKSEKLLAEIEIKNTGNVDGAETVFWYISDPVSTISRPIKELKYFEKKVITAGNKSIFKFEIDPVRDLIYTDSNGKNNLEKGDFFIHVGNQRINFKLTE